MLAEDLRRATRALHIAVEREPFMQTLLRGKLGRPAYVAFLRNLHAIYAALEAALEAQHEDPVVRAIMSLSLRRAPAITADLAVLHGPDWTSLPVLATTHRYVERLQSLDDGSRLVGHVYVRYLGDLSGGQILQPIVAATLASPEGGTAFYDFGGVVEAARLLASLRAALASLELDASRTNAVVAEAVWGFERHRELFQELAEP